MKKKKLLRVLLMGILLVGELSPYDAKAQTDVTSMYLTNADFSSGWTTDNVGNGTVKEVTGWIGASSGTDWYYGGAISYSGGKTINSATVSSNPSGTTSGGALGISAGWGCTVRYTQAVTFPAGKYRISYKAFNANADARQVYNYIGFVETGGTEHYGFINNFIPSTWMEDEIILNFTSETSGNISVGIGAVSKGSGANAKLFVDYIKIEAYNPSVSNMVGEEVTSGNWTGSTGTYSDTYPEYYSGSHFTGDAMTSTTTVNNGTYDAYVYFHSHMAWIEKVAEDGTKNSYIKANNATYSIGIVNNTGFAGYEPKMYHLSDIPVTNGSLVLKVGNSEQGGNWLTVKTAKIVKKVAATLSYGSANFPINGATSVTSDYWYAYTVPLTGDYTITSSAATTVYYSQDGTQTATGGTYTSLDLSANTKSNPINLSAGTLYIKAAETTTLTIAAASYNYNVGAATVSHNYVQGGETITVTYPNAATNNPSASLSVSTIGVKFNGSTPDGLTATANGFTFTVPSGLSAATDYTLNIPAGIVGYAAGSTYNESQEIIIKTPSVFNGTYFFKTDANKYLNRGSDWGTRACVDDWGLPVEVSTDAAGGSTLTFYDVTDRYIYNSGSNIWTDATSKSDATTWYISKLSNGKYRLQSAQQSGKFVKMDSGDDRIYSDGTNENLIVDWTLENPSFHVAQMQAVKDAQAASAASAAGLSNISTVSALATAVASMNASAVITPSKVTSTAEKYQSQSGDIYDKQTIHIPTAGLYKFTIQGFSRIANNDRTYSIHMAGGDVPPVYAYFAGAKTLMTSPFDLEGQTAYSTDCVEKGGYYYPNGQTSAKKFFQDGKFENTIWVYISDAGDYTYGITNIGNSKTNHQQWTCYTTESVSLTLYFSGSLDYVDDGVHYYKGSFAQAPAITLTDTEPVADIQGANFTSGSSALTFNNPNGLVFASSNGQVSSTTKNVVVNGTCASLHLEDSHPFMNPKEFTATKASYTMSAVASGKNYNSENVSMGTLMVPFAASLPSGGSAYTLDQGVNLMDGNIRGTEVSSIAANSPVLVTAEGGYTGSNVTIPVVNNGATYTNGELVGTYTAMTAVEGSYVLQNHTSGEGVAFYLVGSTTQPTVNPFRAYIKSQGSNARALHVVFDDEAQGITNLNDINDNLNGEVYDLQGRRVAQPTKGLYIVNGRKTVIK